MDTCAPSPQPLPASSYARPVQLPPQEASLLASLTGMRAMRSFERRLAVPLALLIMPLARAASQGWIEPIRPLPRGAIEKVRSAVQVAVTGRVARVTVEEWFRNGGMLLDEASYLYPLPGEAVFSDFSLWQGDRELKGEPMDAAQARAIYEDIVRRKRDPALIELAGHGLLRARVFPIAPGETRKITLRYTQLLDRVGDAWRFRYAAGAGSGAAVAQSHGFRLQVDSAARFGDPYSPTHRLTLNRSGDHLELTLPDTAAGGDLEGFLPLAPGLPRLPLPAALPTAGHRRRVLRRPPPPHPPTPPNPRREHLGIAARRRVG